jgi:hypothetical protein
MVASNISAVTTGFAVLNPSNIDGTPYFLSTATGISYTGTLQAGTTTTAALIQGAGTSVSPYAMGATANTNMIGYWGTTTATTGDSRLAYYRLYFSGVGGSGEALRVFGTVNNVTAATGGTVNGAHVSLSVSGASGTISGAGNAIRATLALDANTVAGGTLSVIQIDSDLDNTATIPVTASYLRFTNSNTKKIPIFANLDGVDTSTLYIAAGTGSGSAGNSTHCAAQSVIRINVNGAACYIPIFTQNS